MITKISSILDFSYPFLDPAVWDQDMKLYSYQKDFILRLLDKMYETYSLKEHEKWVDDVVILGSLTTTKWLLSSDLDVHVRVNLDEFVKTNMPNSSKEEAFAKLDLTRKEFDRAKILAPMTQHPTEFYIESLELHPSNTSEVGVYSLYQDQWLKEPIALPAELDIEESKRKVVEEAEALAQELDGSLGKVKRDIQRVDELENVIKAWGKDKQKLFYTKIEKKLNDIEEEIKKDLKIKQDLVDYRHSNQDPTSENEILFKYLARNGFFAILQNLKELLESTYGEVTVNELPLIEKVISQANLNKQAREPGAVWIDPNGKVYHIDTSHADFVADNWQMLRDKYGISDIEEYFNDVDLSGPEIASYLVAQGWSRVGDVYAGTGFGIEVPDLTSISKGVLDYITSSIGTSMEITLEESDGTWVTLDSNDLIQYGQKAVNRALSHKRLQTASIKEAGDVDFGIGWWMSPFGEILSVPRDMDHLEWFYEYGPDYEGEDPIDSGWTRIRQIGRELNISTQNLDNISKVLDQFILEHPSQIIVIETGHGALELSYEDVVNEGITKAVNKALSHKRLQSASLKEAGQVIRTYNTDGQEIQIYQNPSSNQIKTLLSKYPKGGLRYIIDEQDDLYVWDAFSMTHEDAADQLGIEYAPVQSFIEKDEDINNLFNSRTQVTSMSKFASFMKKAQVLPVSQDNPALGQAYIDFDDTLATENPDGSIGNLMEGAKEALDVLKQNGWNIVVYSYRSNVDEDAVKEFLDKNNLTYDSIFIGKPLYQVLVDDRAISFKNNWKEIANEIGKPEKKASLHITSGDIIRLTNDQGEEFRVFKNPTKEQADNILNSSHDKMLRWGVSDTDNNLYMWDAYAMTHEQLKPMLGLHWNAEDAGFYIGEYVPAKIGPFWKSKQLVHASLSTKYWIDPSGKEYPLKDEEGHLDFVRRVFKTPQYHEEQKTEDMLIEGWTRITNETSHNSDFAIEVADLKRIPSYLDNFIAQHYTGNGIEIDDLGGNYVTVSDPFPSIQKQVNKNLRQPVTAKLFSKKEITAQITIQQAIAQITKQYLKEYGTTYDINMGSCEEWAKDVAKLVTGAEIVWLDTLSKEEYAHAVVKYNGKYYDSETPQGVKDWRNLPLVLNQGKTREQVLKERTSSLKQAQTKKVKQGDYSCLMALVPHDLAQEIVEWGVRTVPDDKIYLDESGRLGRELESHITIKYGLLTNNAKHVRRSFNNEKPFRAKLGKVKHFQPPELPFDVLTVEVVSDDLIKANQKVCENFECAEDLVSDDYHPHITIAYMKRDTAKEYIGSSEFEGKELELDTIIFSPCKGNRTYFSISNDKESRFVLEKINKFASGNNFYPSLVQAPNNPWQSDSDLEIPVDPDPVSDEETLYEPCTTGKPRSVDMWRQLWYMIKSPFSKKEVESASDTEQEKIEQEELGENETLLEYSKGFKDLNRLDTNKPKTLWQDNSSSSGGEPYAPLPSFHVETNEMNENWRYPWKFTSRPRGEDSDDGKTIEMLREQEKRKACIGRITREITAGKQDVKMRDGWVTVLYNPSNREALGLFNKSQAHELRYAIDNDGIIYLWDAYYGTHYDVIRELMGMGYTFDYENITEMGMIFNEENLLKTLNTKNVISKQAGTYSASVPDYQGEQYYNEQHMDNGGETAYTNWDAIGNGVWDFNQNTNDFPQQKDMQPQTVFLDILNKPIDRTYPGGILWYSVTLFDSLPSSQGIESVNPD